MKRLTLFALAVVSTLCGLTLLATNEFARDDKHTGRHAVQKTQAKKQNVEPRVNGRTTPDQIPDSAAYEILFRLLSADDPAESTQDRRKATYLKVAGFSNPEAAAVSNAAYEYKRQVEPLDREVDDVKNQHWPSPSEDVMRRLAQLQERKEHIIFAIVRDLQSQLSNYDNPSKFNNHIMAVKRKTKGFETSLPEKKIGYLRKLLSDLFTARAQAPGCDALVYVYNSVSVDWSSFTAFGNGSYSIPANNCGHDITLGTELWGGGYYSSGGSGTGLDLLQGGVYRDGYFMSTTSANGFCPVVSQSFYVGSQTDDETLDPYVRVYPFGNFSPTSVTASGSSQSQITFQLTASYGAGCQNCTVTVTPSYFRVSGNAPLSITMTPSGGAAFSMTGGSTVNFSIYYDPTSITTNPTTVKAEAVVTGVGLAIKYPSSGDFRSTSILTITP